MANVSDDKNAAVGGGNTDTSEQAWLLNQGATSDMTNDAWMEVFKAGGATSDNWNDAALEWLKILGYSGGNLADAWKWHWFSSYASEIALGVGWSQTSSSPDNYQFDVPPGVNFVAATFINITIGKNYNIKFDASGDLPVTALLFKPGNFTQDVVITVGSYDIDFLAQDSNGTPRFAVQDIAGVTQFKIENVRIEEA